MLPSVQTVLTRSLLTLTAMTLFCANAQGQLSEPEQRRITWHESERLSRYRRPASPAPVTVATADPQLKERFITLDEAIAIALRHSEVIRVLTGVSASSTGRTVYDTAVSTTNIDGVVACTGFNSVVASTSCDSIFSIASSDGVITSTCGSNGVITGVIGNRVGFTSVSCDEVVASATIDGQLGVLISFNSVIARIAIDDHGDCGV